MYLGITALVQIAGRGSRDTIVAGAEDGMVLLDPIGGDATRARLALVAGRIEHAEIGAPQVLH